MSVSPYSIRGAGQRREFLQGYFRGLGKSLKPVVALTILHAGRSSAGLHLLEYSAVEVEQSTAGCHRKQSQIISKSINGEGRDG